MLIAFISSLLLCENFEAHGVTSTCRKTYIFLLLRGVFFSQHR